MAVWNVLLFVLLRFFGGSMQTEEEEPYLKS